MENEGSYKTETTGEEKGHHGRWQPPRSNRGEH